MEPIKHGETACPQCGADARWSAAGNEVEITCPNCGVFRVTRAAFDEAVDVTPEDEGQA
jgi:hypothetical protein